jgi:hypothetical protein
MSTGAERPRRQAAARGVVVAQRDPRPLPVALRVLYAPFYVTGLVLRYGVHYLLVAPFEVLGRALTYGPEGGVDYYDHGGP